MLNNYTIENKKILLKSILNFDYTKYNDCLKAVKRNGLNLKYVKNQTEEICLAAIKQDWYSLQFVDDKFLE